MLTFTDHTETRVTHQHRDNQSHMHAFQPLATTQDSASACPNPRHRRGVQPCDPPSHRMYVPTLPPQQLEIETGVFWAASPSAALGLAPSDFVRGAGTSLLRAIGAPPSPRAAASSDEVRWSVKLPRPLA